MLRTYTTNEVANIKSRVKYIIDTYKYSTLYLTGSYANNRWISTDTTPDIKDKLSKYTLSDYDFYSPDNTTKIIQIPSLNIDILPRCRSNKVLVYENNKIVNL